LTVLLRLAADYEILGFLKLAAHKACFVRFFPAASTLHRIWRSGHAHNRQPTCDNAVHEALQREKVTFDVAADE